MKKIFAISIVAAALALAGCWTGPEGDVYLSFDWTYTPQWFDTTDPNLPDTIYRQEIYPTGEGSYCFEYYHEVSRATRRIYYTLTAHDGFFGIPGEDAYFEMFLAAYDNPDLIQWQSVAGDPAAQPDTVSAAAGTPRTRGRFVPDFERTLENGRWTLEVRGGVVEPDLP
jgi:hypothetical protein